MSHPNQEILTMSLYGSLKMVLNNLKVKAEAPTRNLSSMKICLEFWLRCNRMIPLLNNSLMKYLNRYNHAAIKMI